MPKQTVDREQIIAAALEMTRESGFESVNARSVAKRTGYSVQPIYSCFGSMDELREAVNGAAMGFYNEFIYSRVDGEAVLENGITRTRRSAKPRRRNSRSWYRRLSTG